jgi:hypothetical protein
VRRAEVHQVGHAGSHDLRNAGFAKAKNASRSPPNLPMSQSIGNLGITLGSASGRSLFVAGDTTLLSAAPLGESPACHGPTVALSFPWGAVRVETAQLGVRRGRTCGCREIPSRPISSLR